MTYYVRWDIEIDARSPRAAAQEAQRIQRDPQSTATFFDVFKEDENGPVTHIDLRRPK
jgi:hypothetical protein